MGFAEQLARLKGLLAKADGMEMLGPDMYKLTLQQIVGEAEILARKKRREAEAVRQQVAVNEGQAEAFDMIVQIVGNLLETLIHKEEQVRQERVRLEEERRSSSEGPSGPVEPPSTPPVEGEPRPRRRGRPPKE